MKDQTYKFDGGKLQYRLIPPKALEQMAAVMTYGASKYAAHSWVNVSSDRYLDAAYRHIQAAAMGEERDEESKLPHLAHAAINLLFLLERQLDPNAGEKLKSYTQELIDAHSKSTK